MSYTSQHLAETIEIVNRLDRAPIEKTRGVELLDHLRDQPIEGLERELAFVPSDDAAYRVDEHEGRPGADRVGLPDAKVTVVDDRMPDVQSLDSSPDALSLPLGDELRRVYADDDELPAPLPLEPPHLRKDVQAVDSAVGPEVEQDQLAAEIAEA